MVIITNHHTGSGFGPRSKQTSNSSSPMCLTQRYIFILEPIIFLAESNKPISLDLFQWSWKLLCRSYINISVGWGAKEIWNLARKILPFSMIANGFLLSIDMSLPAVEASCKGSRRLISLRNGGVPGGSFTKIVCQVPPLRERQAILWFVQSLF